MGLFVREDVFPSNAISPRRSARVCVRACLCVRECLRVISTGKSVFSQSSREWRRKGERRKKAIFIQIQLQLERQTRLREWEEQKEGRGGKDVICMRDYKECWHDMTARLCPACTCNVLQPNIDNVFLQQKWSIK